MAKSKPFTIIKDTREQDGYSFAASSSRYHTCNGMVSRKLDTGDYSIEGLEDLICIERKGCAEELAQNLGQKKHAFLNEIGLGVDNQNKTMGDGIEKAIKNFKPKKRFNLYKLA